MKNKNIKIGAFAIFALLVFKIYTFLFSSYSNQQCNNAFLCNKIIKINEIFNSSKPRTDARKYDFVKYSPNGCGCPNLKYHSDDSHFDVKSCSPFVKKITDTIKIGNLIHNCESFALKNRNAEVMHYVTISYGEGMDCHSGCIYESRSVIFDEFKKEVVFVTPYNQTPSFIETEAYSYFKGPPSSWLVRNNPALAEDRSAKVDIYCKPYSHKISNVYLFKRDNRYDWAVDVDNEASCSVKYQSPNGGGSSQIGFNFSGTIIRDISPNSRGRLSYDLSLLKMKVESGVDYSLTPTQFEKTLSFPGYKLVVQGDHAVPIAETAEVNLIDWQNRTKKLQKFDYLAFSNNRMWADMLTGFYWVIRNPDESRIVKLDYSTSQTDLIFRDEKGINEFLVSPMESYIIYGNGQLYIYEIASKRTLPIVQGTISDSKVVWLDDKTFSFESQDELPRIDKGYVLWAALENESSMACRENLNKVISQEIGSQKFKIEFYTDDLRLESMKNWLESIFIKFTGRKGFYQNIVDLKDKESVQKIESILRKCPFVRGKIITETL